MNTTNDSPDFSETIFPADPRITAYAFGELEGDELTRVEAAVNADPALQAAVAELRGFGGQLTTALGDEQTGAEAETATSRPPAPEPVAVAAPKKRRGVLLRFHLHYLATAAAACFAVVVWVRQEPTRVEQRSDLAPTVCVAPLAEMAAMKMPAASLAVRAPEAPSVKFDQTLASGKELTVAEFKHDGGLLGVDVTGAALASSSDVFANAKAAAIPMTSPVSSGVLQASAAQAVHVANESDGALVVRSGQLIITHAKEGQGLGAVVIAGKSSQSGGLRAREPAPAALLASGANVIYSDVLPAAPAPMRRASLVDGLRVDRDQERTNERADAYAHPGDNAYRTVSAEPLSTFSVDVDTASYANVRRFLSQGSLPPRDAVRIEELINYFPYRYTPPVIPGLGVSFAGEVVPFAAKLEAASAPWAPAHRLVRIGIKGAEFTAATRPPANLVFLIDVSGSMSSANKLPLVKESLRMLVERLRPDDRVAIVTYAGSSGLALPSTPASKKNEILAALDNLDSGGSTNGAMGIHLAYDIAKANFVGNGGLNRVILCTDGDFNVGVTNQGELVRLIEEKAKSRVFLSVFGYGMGNLKDATLESLADKGNGTYGYIDTRREAEKVFVEQVNGTLATIAKDVKIQVEFNPARVASYRLIGYENRILAKEDFNNDAVDAGDIGAGHTVTALYEIVPVGAEPNGAEGRPAVDVLKYQKSDAPKPAEGGSTELLTVKIRYKAPQGDVSKKQEFTLTDTGAEFTKAEGEFQFAAAVAAWGMLLRDSPHKGTATFEQVLGWAENGLGNDEGGYRAEFLQLVRRSAALGK